MLPDSPRAEKEVIPPGGPWKHRPFSLPVGQGPMGWVAAVWGLVLDSWGPTGTLGHQLILVSPCSGATWKDLEMQEDHDEK